MLKSNKIPDLKKLAEHPAMSKHLDTIAKQEYTTPFFILRETLAGFARHNVMSMSASLSFYALFALIPLILLIFFLLSHLVFTSDYAIVKLAILTSNLVPDLSNNIMLEVYHATETKAVWGAIGLIVLLWTITPLASAMRSSFYTIAAKIETPSFFRKKIKDLLSVMGILLLFFLFTSAGFIVERIIRFLATHANASQLNILGSVLTLLVTTLLIAGFYRVFFPMRVALKHLLLGAFITAILWLIMRYAFGLFLTINKNYGAVFGGMKAMFVSITWLYLNFAVFLLGTELIATLRKKDVLLLKGLFDDNPNRANYIAALMKLYGKALVAGDKVITLGSIEKNLYFIVEGTIHILQNNQVKRILQAGEYFGEVIALSDQPSKIEAIVVSEEARLIVIYAENVDTMLTEYPKIAMRLLKQMAYRMQNN
jgi:membrane protein